MERCPSGLRCKSRKFVWGNSTEGSNPSLSDFNRRVNGGFLIFKSVFSPINPIPKNSICQRTSFSRFSGVNINNCNIFTYLIIVLNHIDIR